ncbi:CD1375 family protein [Vagococcus fluvialis]|nr:CD1375 family protein [Vagococcus fluvialis]
MIQVYASLIQKGLKKIEEVPKQFRKEVQAILDSETQE